MSRPAYINIGSPTSKFEPVIDVAAASFTPRKTSYKVSFDSINGRKEEREPTAENLMHKYFPFYLVDEIVKASNKYRMERKLREPHLKLWKKILIQSPTSTFITSLPLSTTWEYANSHVRQTTGKTIH